MTRLELLAGLLDGQALDHEVQAPQQTFSNQIEFWQLCMEAYRLLLDRQEIKRGDNNDTNISG